MLELDKDLPQGALLHAHRDRFEQSIHQSGTIWFKSSWDAFDIDKMSGAITGWQSIGGAQTASPTDPNDANGMLTEIGNHAGLRCVQGVHCGLAVPEITENAGTFSMAVIYQPTRNGPAKTLLTVNTGYSGKGGQDSNYLFLSDGGDYFTVKDVRGSFEITAPVTSSPDDVRMAIVTLSGDTLALAENLKSPTIMHGADAGMRSAADLFIGCRSHRSGLKKTLGASVILEVFFWPKHALLVPRTAQDEAEHVNLKQYFLWEY